MNTATLAHTPSHRRAAGKILQKAANVKSIELHSCEQSVEPLFRTQSHARQFPPHRSVQRQMAW